MINELAHQKKVGLVACRKRYKETGEIGQVEVSAWNGIGWSHYVFTYSPKRDSLIQDQSQ